MMKRFAYIVSGLCIALGALTACGSQPANRGNAETSSTGQPTPVLGVQNTPGQGAAGPEAGSENTGNQPNSGGAVAVLPTTTTSASDNPQAPKPNAGSPQATGAATGAASGGTSNASGNNSAAVPQGKLDPCTLVSNADIAELVGVTVNNGTRIADQNGALTCQYSSTAGNTSSVAITLYDEPAQVSALRQRLAQAQSPQQVSGLGNEALIANNALYVRVGNVYVAVIVVTPGQPARSGEAARSLAERAILRLPVIF